MIRVIAIHNFWVELFPIFQESYEFVYVFFDIATIIFFIDVILTLPKILLFRGKKL